MGYNLLINGIYWGYNPLTNLLLTAWDIQVGDELLQQWFGSDVSNIRGCYSEIATMPLFQDPYEPCMERHTGFESLNTSELLNYSY